jgi:hypothetical protein
MPVLLNVSTQPKPPEWIPKKVSSFFVISYMIYYIYVNDEGFEFSVYSSTGHVGIDDSTTSFYKKRLTMNYLSNMIKYKSKDLTNKGEYIC